MVLKKVIMKNFRKNIRKSPFILIDNIQMYKDLVALYEISQSDSLGVKLYFFISDGDSCWKCDEMSFTNCATNGAPELCKNGDKDCCFVEVRETKQALQQLCTGCKSKNSCENLRDENFTSLPGARDQCRPNYRYQTVSIEFHFPPYFFETILIRNFYLVNRVRLLFYSET